MAASVSAALARRGRPLVMIAALGVAAALTLAAGPPLARCVLPCASEPAAVTVVEKPDHASSFDLLDLENLTVSVGRSPDDADVLVLDFDAFGSAFNEDFAAGLYGSDFHYELVLFGLDEQGYDEFLLYGFSRGSWEYVRNWTDPLVLARHAWRYCCLGVVRRHPDYGPPPGTLLMYLPLRQLAPALVGTDEPGHPVRPPPTPPAASLTAPERRLLRFVRSHISGTCELETPANGFAAASCEVAQYEVSISLELYRSAADARTAFTNPSPGRAQRTCTATRRGTHFLGPWPGSSKSGRLACAVDDDSAWIEWVDFARAIEGHVFASRRARERDRELIARAYAAWKRDVMPSG